MNIAVVGSGYWGKNIVRNYYELGNLYAVCENNPDKIVELKGQYPDIKIYQDYEELLKDKSINGIAIATPVPTHFTLAKKSLEAGFPTYVEKPLTLSNDEANILREISEKNNLPLMVGHILEYHPAMIKMQELVREGSIGDLKHIRCTRINLGKIRAHENIWWSFAPHDLSIIFMLINQDPVEVKASSFKPLQDGVEDTVYADLIFENGKSAHIHVSWLEPIKLHQTVVIGEKGMIVFNDTLKEDKLKLYKYSFNESVPDLAKEDEITIPYPEAQPLRQECLHFMECIKNKTTPKTDGKNACRVVKVLEYVHNQLKGDG